MWAGVRGKLGDRVGTGFGNFKRMAIGCICKTFKPIDRIPFCTYLKNKSSYELIKGQVK